MRRIKAGICLEIILIGLIAAFYIFTEDLGTYEKEAPAVQAQTAREEAESTQSPAEEAAEQEAGTLEETEMAVQAADAKETAVQDADTRETAAQAAPALSDSIIQYARQFIGNPYVWGGTSLTQGADCSGFVQSVYEEFGVSLPRTSREQALVGERISVDEARPGDLIFYARDGEVYHVVIYTGDGQSVQAKSSEEGIKEAPVDYSHAVWAVRVC